MAEYIENKHGPCKEKQCGQFCDPVKIVYKKGFEPSNIPIPRDRNDNPIRIPKKEIRIPESNIDTQRLQIYECLLYDKEHLLCGDYEHRPNICRNTSCIDYNSDTTIDDQYKKLTESNFIKIKQ